MFKHSLTAKRIFLNIGLLVTAMVFAAGVRAQPQDSAERQRALELYESNNFAAALPLLEKLVVANPNDVVVLSHLGFALYANSATEKDPTARRQKRARARTMLLRARSLGDDSNLTRMALDSLSAPDATDIPFSDIKAAEAAIREGEAAFVRGDMDKAIAAYKRALELDPQLYDAAVYAGDSEFKKAHNSTDPRYRSDHFDAAGVWFAKAIAIDPDRETAYRYWGDALDAQGKSNEARDKFIEAIIAQPYSRQPYVGLTQWAERHKATLGHPKIQPPNSTDTQGGQTTLTIDPKTLNSADGSNQWMMYDLTRIAWAKGDFLKNYPNEKEYRHSLKEEAAALRMVAEFAARDLKSGKIKALEPSLGILVKLNEDSLLESYILFARPDQGIARDYPSYRAANRDKLRRYWLDVVIVK
jgi:tetratricopeptide (TPR) repeat protein